MVADPVTLTLPYPPSVNNLYRNAGNRRVKTEAYMAWLNAAGWELRRQRPGHVPGRYRLSLVLTPPDGRARDADNTFKAVSDLLKTCGVIAEDSLAKAVSAEWSDDPPQRPGRVVVTISPAQPQEAQP